MRRATTWAAAAMVAAAAVLVSAQSRPAPAPARVTDGVAYTASGQVIRPTNYREWMYLTSGLGMTYGPTQPAAGRPPIFDNVFVNPQSYKAFMSTGQWPDGTMFILELRRSVANASINNGGFTQTDVAMLEAAVKDSQRFADTGGWKYLELGAPPKAPESSSPLPPTASCYACHATHTAVENTFVQFYPTLFEVAREKGTVKPTYDPNRKVQ